MAFADDDRSPVAPSEADVAETIVQARKSWKTVKGKSEPVWPPHLEKALVKALLQYKPNDSRYARALGRFPKRNRFISDFIYEQTGVRRSPKQVGSRLQQLKDVNCGKQLLNQVASWSLGSPPRAAAALPGTDLVGSNFSVHSTSQDGSPSPPSHYAHVNSNPGLNNDSFPSPLASSMYSPGSSYGSLPVTPQARRINVFVSYLPGGPHTASRRGHGQPQPFKRFSGCLARPESVFPLDAHDVVVSASEIEPVVTFMSREPIAAQSVSTVWAGHGQADGRAPGGSGAFQGNGNTPQSQLHRENSPLMCTQMPAVASMASPHSSYSSDEDGSPQMRPRQDLFVYTARLVGERYWDSLCQGEDLSRFTITQDLICNFENSAARRGETFLSLSYHFVPASPPASSAGQRLHLHSSVSPSSSSSSPSPISASPASTLHHQLHPHSQAHAQSYGQMHSSGHHRHAPYGAHSQGHSHSYLPQLSLAVPGPTTGRNCNMGGTRTSGRGHHQLAAQGANLGYSAGYLPGPMLCSDPLSGGYPPMRTGMTPAPFDLEYDGLNVEVNHLNLSVSPIDGEFGIGPTP